MKSFLSFIVVFSLSLISFAQGSVRSITPKEDEIIQIRTALGIATLVQLPETIQSAIIGDQTAFRVEPVDRSITVKPLRYGAKTNLYLLTDKKRYNLRLTALSQDSADYIVYVKENTLKASSVKWYDYRGKKEDDYKTLSIKRVGHTQSGFLLIEGEIRAISPSGVLISPEYFWIRQSGNQKIINSIYLSDLKAVASKPIQFGLSIAKTDLVSKSGLIFEYGSDKKLGLNFSEGVVWR